MHSNANSANSTPDIPSISEQQRYWDARWDRNRKPNGWQLRRGETILNFLRTLHLDTPVILDLGCASGWFTEKLSQIGQATGIDLSETAITLAKSQFPGITFIAGNIFELPIPQNHFDLVVAQEVIAHVEDQIAFLERIAYTLKPGGFLIATAANKIVMDRVDFGPDPKEHIKQWLYMRTLKRLLLPQFKVLRATTVIPMGNRGFLRLINSYKINAALGLLIPRRYLENLKERAGLGYSLIVLAQKRS